MANIVRVLIAKPGLDGHDRGAKVVARGLRDAGFEVIYTGLHQTPEMVVSAALQEDVDVIGLSILSGAHLPLVESILKGLKKEGLAKPVFVGGIIPGDDAKLLSKMGVAAVFGPGTPLSAIAESVGKFAAQKKPGASSSERLPTKSKKTRVKNGAGLRAKPKNSRPSKPKSTRKTKR